MIVQVLNSERDRELMSARTPEPLDANEYRNLRILEELERNPSISQRELASSLGVALGIANACLHALVRKGMIKISGDNNRSITYHLTKKGVGQKAVLAVQWTRNTVDYYVQARGSVAVELAALVEAGVRRVVIYGSSDLAEITLIAASDFPLEVVGVIRDPSDRPRERVVTVPVTDLDSLAVLNPDAVIVTAEGIAPDTAAALLKAAQDAGEGTLIQPVIDRERFAKVISEVGEKPAKRARS